MLIPLGRLPGIRQIPARVARLDPRAVLFESWHGSYSDNPRAIAEELQRRRPDLDHLWSLDGDGADVPEPSSFRPGSRAYLSALGSARYLVANQSMPGYFRKRPGTTYLQTWHGTPLKRIAFDIERPIFMGSDKYLESFRRDVEQWDVLISPNRFSTEVFRQAFRYDGRIIETGYPRNDVLSSPTISQTTRALRAELGIPEGAQAILYAPTWRDDESFSLQLDLENLTAQLGDEYFVLLRAHKRVADTVPSRTFARVSDVSHYADIRDLYLAADVLLTDYSSAMFDFAVTGKPMLFYTYDLAEYRDDVRGFYFDFEKEAPGPLLPTTADVHGALRDLDGVRRSYAAAYASFTERFCYLEDGRASARVIDEVFSDGGNQ